MPTPRLLPVCVLVLAAIGTSGCGSSKKTSTPTTATVNATTTTSAPASTQPATQSTGSSGPQTGGTPSQTSTQGTPSAQGPLPHTTSQATKPASRPVEPGLTSRREFPLELQRSFIGAWLAAGGSKSSAECMIHKYEAWKVEKGRALAELVGTELVLNNHLKLNRRAKRYARECHGVVH